MNLLIYFFAFPITFGISVATSTAQDEAPTTRTQIINATSVPKLSLGTEDQLLYSEFPQGIYSGDGPTTRIRPKYKVTDTTSGRKREIDFQFPSNGMQSLVLIGDFRPTPDGDVFPNPLIPVDPDKPDSDVSVKGIVVSHALLENEKPIRITFINGFPDASIRVNVSGASYDIPPGDQLPISGNENIVRVDYQVESKEGHIYVMQESFARNVIVAFFKKGDEIGNVYVFENTAKYFEAIAEEPVE